MQNELTASSAIEFGKMLHEAKSSLSFDEFKHELTPLPFSMKTVSRLIRIYQLYKDRASEMGNYSMSILYKIIESKLGDTLINKIHELAKGGRKITEKVVDAVKSELSASAVQVVEVVESKVENCAVVVMEPVIEVKPVEVVQVAKVEEVVPQIKVDIAALDSEPEAPRKIREGSFFVGQQVRFEDRHIFTDDSFMKVLSRNPLLMADSGVIVGFRKGENEVTLVQVKWKDKSLNKFVNTLPAKFICKL